MKAYLYCSPICPICDHVMYRDKATYNNKQVVICKNQYCAENGIEYEAPFVELKNAYER